VLVDDLLEEDVELVEDALAAGEEARPAGRPAALGKKSSAEKLAIMSMASSSTCWKRSLCANCLEA